MKENDIGGLFLRHLVMAIPWGIVFLIVMFIAAVGIKQQMKEGIQYAFRTGIQESANFVYNYQVVVPVKKNVKEGIEFVVKTAGNEIRAILKDPQFKKYLKDVLESDGRVPR